MTKNVRAVVLCVAIAVGCTNANRATTRPVAVVRPTTQAIDPVIARIREEGLQHSEVMDTLDVLLNVIGPRLTASPGQLRASDWTRDHLAGWGLANAHLEPWGPFGRGWSVDRFSMRVTSPTMFVPIGFPKAWSSGLDAPLSADVVFLDAKNEFDLADYEGDLRGKIVLVGQPRVVDARFEPLAKRLTDEELAKLAAYVPGQENVPDRQAPETANERRARFAAATARNEALLAASRPTTHAGARPTTNPTGRSTTRSTTRRAATAASTTTTTTSPATTQAGPRGFDPFVARMIAFANDEGAAVIVTPSSIGDGGTFFVQQAAIPGDPPRRPTTRPRVWSDDAPKIPPQVTLAVEDYNRLARAARRGEAVRADVDLATSFHGKSISPTNTIAEIPGTDLADEVVMVGAHLDSWHSGTGATDNGVGSACAMEAVRILKALDLHPRRTIRVALWTGEEQGIFGSEAYVKQHFGYTPEAADVSTTKPSPATSQSVVEFGTPSAASAPSAPASAPATTRAAAKLVKLPEYEKLSVYINLDNGTGKIRGIYTQGNAAAVPIFREWFKPFADLDAKTITMQDTGGTDHLSFDAVGLPGFQFIQDPIEYGSRTHHSNQDVYDRIQPEDAKQASTIMAAFLWDAANAPTRFPRKPAPTDAK